VKQAAADRAERQAVAAATRRDKQQANKRANMRKAQVARQKAKAAKAAARASAAAARAVAASAAQAKSARAKARAVLAAAASSDRGGPSQRSINAAIEVLGQVDTFASGGQEHGGFDPQGGTTGSSGMGDWT